MEEGIPNKILDQCAETVIKPCITTSGLPGPSTSNHSDYTTESDPLIVLENSPYDIHSAEEKVNECKEKVLYLKRKLEVLSSKLALQFFKDNPSVTQHRVRYLIRIHPEIDEVEAEIIIAESNLNRAITKLNFCNNLFIVSRKKVTIDIELTSKK